MNEADGVLGTVIEGDSSEITVRARLGKDVVVRTSASSRLGSGAEGTVANLSDFVLGDTVVATGEFDENNVLTADFVNSLLVERTLRIEDISPGRGRDEEHGEEVALEPGILPDNNRSRVDLAQLEIGQVVRALTWTHPADGVTYLLAVA